MSQSLIQPNSFCKISFFFIQINLQKKFKNKINFRNNGSFKIPLGYLFCKFFCKGSKFWSSIFSILFSGRVQFWANNCKCNSIFCLLTGLVQIFPTSAALTVTQTPIGQTLSICDDQTMLPEVLLNWNGGCLGVRCSAGENKIH